MRYVRLLFAYLLGIPFLLGGGMAFFIGTFWFGVLSLFIAGLIVAWGWMPFIATGKELVAKERARMQDGYATAKERKEPSYDCQDILE